MVKHGGTVPLQVQFGELPEGQLSQVFAGKLQELKNWVLSEIEKVKAGGEQETQTPIETAQNSQSQQGGKPGGRLI